MVIMVTLAYWDTNNMVDIILDADFKWVFLTSFDDPYLNQ